MDVNSNVLKVVAFVIVAVLAVGVILPMLASGENVEVTRTNGNSIDWRYSFYDDSADHVLEVDNEFTFDGEVIGDSKALFSDSFRIFAVNQLYIYGDEEMIVDLIANVDFNSGSATFRNAHNAVMATVHYEWFYISDDNGEYVAVDGGAHLQASTSYHAISPLGGTENRGALVEISTDGTTSVIDGFTYSDPTFTDATASTTAAVVEDDGKYTATYTVGELSGPLFILADHTYTATEKRGGMEGAIIEVIPVLVIVGVLVFTVGMFISNRRV